MHDGNVDSGFFWHEMGRAERHRVTANEMLEKIWKVGAQKRGETTPNIKTFIEYEYQEGLRQFHAPFPNADFQTTLYYRKVLLSELLAQNIVPSQLAKITNFPLRRTDFDYKTCDAEMEFHYNWRLKNHDKYPMKEASAIEAMLGNI